MVSYLWQCSVTISLPSLLFGYCISSLNSLMVLNEGADFSSCYDHSNQKNDVFCPIGSLLRDLKLNTVSQEVATALTILGAWLGCTLVASPLMERWGRRRTLMGCDTAFIVGAGLCAGAAVPWMLFLGRLVVGVAVGVESMAVPALLSEISSEENRGLITAAHQFMITLGILTAGLVGYASVTLFPSGWRLMQALTAAPALVQLLLSGFWSGYGFLPESPAWLMSQERAHYYEAKDILCKLRGLHPSSHSAEFEIEEIKRESAETAGACRTTWTEVFENGQPVKVGVAIMSFQAACGINTVIFYSSEVFSQAGVHNSLLATVVVGIANVVMTAVAMVLIDRVGRKTLLLRGTQLMVVSLVMLSMSLFFLQSSFQGTFCVIFTLLYIIGFAVGFGGVGFVIICEIVPFRIRSKAMSLFLSCNWLLNLLLSLFSLSVIDFFASQFHRGSKQQNQKAGVAMVFSLFALICLASLVFIYLFVKETKQKLHHHQVSMKDAQPFLSEE